VTASDRIRLVEPIFRRVSDKTVWSFVTIETQSGLIGTGEATLPGQEMALKAEITALAGALAGTSCDPDELPVAAASELADLPRAAARSAVDLALWDIAAQRQGRPLHTLLGTPKRDTVPLYANINRRTLDRSPSGIAASARDALAVGFESFKIAPFDGLSPRIASTPAGRPLIEDGIARVAALRAAIGPDFRLMVDCHWRFDEASARETLRELDEFRLHWFECPLPESAETLAALGRLRKAANARGIMLAGAELMSTLAGFQPFIEAGAYDVMMPDVKYAGGLREMLRIAAALARAGIAFSPHNPTGPVCHAASLHVSALAECLTQLELQFDESPLFWSIVDGDLPQVGHGSSRLPRLPGLGVRLRPHG
jgi:galactonate dehydratase